MSLPGKHINPISEIWIDLLSADKLILQCAFELFNKNEKPIKRVTNSYFVGGEFAITLMSAQGGR